MLLDKFIYVHIGDNYSISTHWRTPHWFM